MGIQFTTSSNCLFKNRRVQVQTEAFTNRAFQGVIPGTQNALNSWQPYNGAFLSVTSKTKGVTSALPNSLQVRIPNVVTGPIGFENTGYWGNGLSFKTPTRRLTTYTPGIKVQEGWTYKGSFYAKSDSFTGKISVSLKSKQGTTFATSSVSGVAKEWKKFSFELEPTVSAANDDNVFSVTVDGGAAAGKTIFFGMFSLFPPTYRGRENGMRIDLAQALAATKPSIWRFPGGNNLEGHSFDTRWKWNETIGRIEDRPGRVGDWGYSNTDGLGLLEYLNWAEDLEAEPILGIYSGISIANYSDLATWPVVPEQDLQPYIDDALNEIEFVIGDAKTTEGGKLRASLGRTEPYELRFIEIGNEDQEWQPVFRWRICRFMHTYKPHSKLALTDQTVTSTNDLVLLGDIPSGRLAYPTLEGAAAEAAYMTGMERNSDVVFASAYAPSLQHIRSYEWTPDIITYDASRLVKSTSYYVQEMFSVNRGTHVLQTSPASTSDTAPLFWIASYHNETNTVFLKVSNTGTTDLVAKIFLDFPITGFGTATSISSPALSPISGLFNVSNTLEDPELIIPVASSFAIPLPDRFNYTFPATSVTVISLQTSPLTAV
ncbi:hypothetical protein DXG01_002105 [Tephrocybe rancida]|nr:hypothetical protein DXG01_002105 [Tephrocybe rancida]